MADINWSAIFLKVHFLENLHNSKNVNIKLMFFDTRYLSLFLVFLPKILQDENHYYQRPEFESFRQT